MEEEVSSSGEFFCGSMSNRYNDRNVGHLVAAGCCASNGGSTSKKVHWIVALALRLLVDAW